MKGKQPKKRKEKKKKQTAIDSIHVQVQRTTPNLVSLMFQYEKSHERKMITLTRRESSLLKSKLDKAWTRKTTNSLEWKY